MVAIGEIDGISLQAGVFPNPVVSHSYFTLSIDSPLSGDVEVAIFSTNGQLVNRQSLYLQKGMNNFPLPSPEMGGLYFLQIIYENEQVGWLKIMVR